MRLCVVVVMIIDELRVYYRCSVVVMCVGMCFLCFAVFMFRDGSGCCVVSGFLVLGFSSYVLGGDRFS